MLQAEREQQSGMMVANADFFFLEGIE